MARLNDFMPQIFFTGLGEYILSHGSIAQYAKGTYLCHSDCVCRSIGVVRSGYFKFSTINSIGEECITGFVFENDIVTDFVHSFISGKPSPTSIIAGSNAEVIQISTADARNFMFGHNPEFLAKSTTVLLQEAYRRYLDLHTRTAAERYIQLITHHHNDISKIPQQEIASYLTISRRHLQRIKESLRQID